MFTRTIAAIFGATLLTISGAAIAEETTTTTTTTTQNRNDPGVTVGVPGVVGVEIGKDKPDCARRTVTKTDGEGDSMTKTATRCD